MRAAVLFSSPGRLSIEDVTLDEPRRDEVVVKLHATGLCHSDLHVLHGSGIEGPTVLGHEGAGVVVSAGSDVTYVKPGDRVISCPTGFCGRCEFCLAGRPTLCLDQASLRRTGRIQLGDSGAPCLQFAGLSTFAEEMLVHENNLVKIDDDIPLESAALVGCGVATGVGAVLRTAQVRPGSNVAVIGCGGIGLNCIQGAVIAGANRIVAIDINDGKLQLASEFGATDLINNSTGDAPAQLRDLLAGLDGVDYSFEAIGRKETFELAFELLRPGGTATLCGVTQDVIELPGLHFLRERRIQGCFMGSVRFRQDLPFFLDLYRLGRLKLDELVSNRLPLEDINLGYDAIADGSIARSVVVFDG